VIRCPSVSDESKERILDSCFDVIGDIHGHADALHRLLTKLGYAEQGGAYAHPDRKVIFLGDFIDRGPDQMEVLRVARAMHEAGNARSVMGNHEFNAMCWATPNGRGGHLRPHTEKNEAQHHEFLRQIGAGSPAHEDTLAWFRTLPVWIDLGGLRLVHACWHETSQSELNSSCLDAEQRFTTHGILKAGTPGTPEYRAAEILLKGPEAGLPNGHSFRDKDGHERHEARIRWWDSTATTFRQAALGMEGREADLPDDPIPSGFSYDKPQPVLFGHYWMSGTPAVLAPHASCLDFSIAKGGVLTAYRWSGEPTLKADNLVWVR
jgi:hypothetical protein